MNLISSCQAVTHTILISQPYKWYFLIFVSLMLVKAVSTLFKSPNHVYSTRTKLPKKLITLLERYYFPVDRIIYIKSKHRLAFTKGLLSPKIYISSSLLKHLSAKELEAVILHEIYHAQNYHPFQVAISKIITSMCAVLPIIEDFAQYYWLILETRADTFAQTKQHSTRYLKKALSKMLITPVPNFAIGFAYQALDQRINYLLTNQRPRLRLTPLKTFISFFVICGLFFYSHTLHTAQALESEYQVSNQCTLSQCLSNCVSETFNSPAPQLSPDMRYSSAN